MKKISILFLSVLLWNVLTSQIIEVKQDGTGDFTIIQEAVDASSAGNTVLVWPGTYFENVNLTGKNITLASLAFTTGDESYKYSTIINGNQTGSCMYVSMPGTTLTIYGFTLMNGSGNIENDWNYGGGGIYLNGSTAEISHCLIKANSTFGGGGGIYLQYTEANINNCIIYQNYSRWGGGGVSCSWYSNATFSNTRIYQNHDYIAGGGIMVGYLSEAQFDPINRCNIYENYSERGCDIHKSNAEQAMVVLVDTFTVINPDTYFLLSIDGNSYPIDDVTFEAMHSKITPYDGDLYVDPVNGNDMNNGNSPYNPLRSVAWAYTKIAVDSSDRNTIHLANGVYSDSSNNEKFPLNVRPYINVEGQSMNGTIFDGRNKTKFLNGNVGISNYTFSNLYMKRGAQVDYENTFLNDFIFARMYIQKENIAFDSITFDGGVCDAGNSAMSVTSSYDNLSISNCSFKNTSGERAFTAALSHFDDTCRITNCSFINNKPDYNHPLYVTGGGIRLEFNRAVALITNCLFDNNDTDAIVSTQAQTFMSNCTFVNNSKEVAETSAVLARGSDFYMYNCILYNNGPSPVWVSATDYFESELYVYNSLLEGGQQSITVMGDSYLYYDEATNINADPVFTGQGEFLYQINDNSPCIDAGTLNLPAFLKLPEFDLAGNPRVVGSAIDMGAYEWNPSVGIHQNKFDKADSPKHLSAAPNPFDHTTNIQVLYDSQQKIKIEVFNSLGYLVKTLLNDRTGTGRSQILWQGNDDNNNPLPSGIFIVVLSYGNQEVESMKVVKK